MAEDKGKGPGSEDWLKELSSFRREAMQVSDEDLRSWRDEVLRQRPGQNEPQTPKPPRRMRSKKKPVAPIIALMVLAGGGAYYFSTDKKPAPIADPFESAATVAPSSEPSVSPEADRPAPRTDVEMTRALLSVALAQWEREWARPLIEKHFPPPHVFENAAPWGSLSGEVVHFAPFAGEFAFLQAARGHEQRVPVTPQGALEALREALIRERSPAEDAVADLLMGRAASSRDGARKLLETGDEADRQVVALVEILASAWTGETLDTLKPRLEKLAADDADRWRLGAMLALTGGDAERALAVLEEGVTKVKAPRELQYRQAWVERVRGEPLKCRERLKAMAAANSEAAGPSLILAALAVEAGDRVAASNALLQLQKIDPRTQSDSMRAAIRGLEADVRIAELSANPEKRLEVVRNHLDQVQKFHPGSGWGLLARARLEREEGRPDAAQGAYGEFLQQAPSTFVQYELAGLMEKENRLARAFAALRPIRALDRASGPILQLYEDVIDRLDRDDLNPYLNSTPGS